MPAQRRILSNAHPYVREWAAFLALEWEASRAEEVLEEIGQSYSCGPGMLSFTAKFTLEW